MKYEIGGFLIWAIVYAGMKLSTEAWLSTDWWFLMGCVAGLLCATMRAVVRELKKYEEEEV